MKTLCKYLGGSHSYGLAIEGQSDKDERGLFIHTEIPRILGLERYEHESKQTEEVDSFYWELRHFLNLLRRGNTMCLEMLYNNNWIEITEEFKLIQSYRHLLIDSHKLYKCLRGYTQSERQLVLGKRTGVLGGKRREHLEKYGYSYKNLVQFMRLCYCGSEFFQNSYFPVNVRETPLGEQMYKVKTQPEKYTKDDAICLMNDYEIILENSYKNIKEIRSYDEKIANQLCFELYMPNLLKFCDIKIDKSKLIL